MWYVYMVSCRDQSLYTGITKDIHRRLEEHNSSPKGAKYTRSRRPVKLVYYEKMHSRSEATKRERQIKQMSVFKKQHLLTKR